MIPRMILALLLSALVVAAGSDATFNRPPRLPCVRAKNTFTRQSSAQWVQHHAWTQAAFGDGRREM